ncbi:MAG: hypothetical protein E4H33_04840 [Anaerolineales bacterium]|nr:MAG: hypothetical protein E4H33_04840 [Anaerolineales bacterium]
MDDLRDQLPDLNRLSILVSTILLAYSLTHFVSIPPQELRFLILGVYFNIQINFTTLVSLLVAGLTASGSAWLLQDHPARVDNSPTIVHWMLPSLTSLVLMLAINQLPFGGIWWIASTTGGLLLMLVLVAEYIVLDPSNRFFLPAEMGITALSIVLFLILAISIHAAETRLFFRIPILSVAAVLVTLRIIHLRQGGIWALTQGSASFLLIGEIAAGLHYWPVGSISFGIALAGPLYALIEISDYQLVEDSKFQPEKILWPLVILILSWGIAFFL